MSMEQNQLTRDLYAAGYESNNLAEHTIQELVDPSGNSLLSDMSADVNTQKILSSMDNITFVQEKSKYFREMRQRQDIQRNDFALEYTVTSASIEDNVATLSIIEHISFHYSSFPDTLSELVNYDASRITSDLYSWLIFICSMIVARLCSNLLYNKFIPFNPKPATLSACPRHTFFPCITTSLDMSFGMMY